MKETEEMKFQSLGRKYPLEEEMATHSGILAWRIPWTQEPPLQSVGWEDPLQKGMATHSNILAWRIPWTQEPGGLQSSGLQRVGHE